MPSNVFLTHLANTNVEENNENKIDEQHVIFKFPISQNTMNTFENFQFYKGLISILII